jgi:hypothetical protein
MVSGIFASSHLKYEYEKNNTDEQPTISNMVEAAIKVLQKNTKGFFLMVSIGSCFELRRGVYKLHAKERNLKLQQK